MTKSCRSCGYKVTPFFSLGKMPLVNSFLTKKQLKSEKAFELGLAYCSNCHLVQLTHTVPPDELFTDYIYFSSVSQTILDHAKRTADELTTIIGLKKDDQVLEVASNDGYLLQFFQKKGMNVLGVDPAKNIAKVANENGISTEATFFNHAFAKKLHTRGVSPKLIFGANVLAHAPEIDDFVRGVATVLPSSGRAVFEFPYLGGLFEGKFDTIYHEHVFYYSLTALRNVFARAGLRVYDWQMVNMQGGSLRIFIGHENQVQDTDRCQVLLQLENDAGYTKLTTYKKLASRIARIKRKLVSTLKNVTGKGKRVVAYSAPAKGVILLNYFGIGTNFLSAIVDKAPQKHGLYVPGVHMEVLPVETIEQIKPDYLLVLCWNIADEVKKQLSSYSQSGGKFIVPIPKVEVS